MISRLVLLALLGATGGALEAGEIRFQEMTAAVGLETPPTWKYGGPTIADLNHDGHYDLLLGSHDRMPIELWWGRSNGTFKRHPSEILPRADVHGMAAGDYDLDGDADLVVMLGGGNGLNPQPPRLFRNDAGSFVDVTTAAGLAGMGARGRSPRWIDLNADGFLDLIQINAAQMAGESGPRNLVFRNQGDGTFAHQPDTGIEHVEAERVLITDFTGDFVPDLVAFTPLSLWRGGDNFSFTEVTDDYLPADFHQHDFILAAASADIDNDGDFDLYLARGKTHYQIANNSLHFDRENQRVDIRDEGNEGRDGMRFSAPVGVTLSDFWHWPRARDLVMPVFLGEAKVRHDPPTRPASFSPEDAPGFPTELTENGWYLGHLGEGRWRFAWNLNGNLAWGVRASVRGVTSVTPDFEPQNRRVSDILLRNDGNRFTDLSVNLPAPTRDNNWGVATGDFDGDGRTDFFVHRFGTLRKRIADVLLANQGEGQFDAVTDHGANVLPEESHGDMGAAFDFDGDGRVDLLSGDDDNGRWRLYRNVTSLNANYLNVRVLYSPGGVDPLGARVNLTTTGGTQWREVQSGSAAHSQSQLNILSFGISPADDVESVTVRWRDDHTSTLTAPKPNQTIIVGAKIRDPR